MVDSSLVNDAAAEVGVLMSDTGVDPLVAVNRVIREWLGRGIALEAHRQQVLDLALDLVPPDEHPLIVKAAAFYKERRNNSTQREAEAMNYALDRARVDPDYFPFFVGPLVAHVASHQ